MADRDNDYGNNDYQDRGFLNWLDWLTMTLVIIGALNWGLMGLSGFLNNDANEWNVVNMLFGSVPGIEWLIYSIIGLAGLYQIYFGYKLTRDGRRRS